MAKERATTEQIVNFLKDNSYLGGLPESVLKAITAGGQQRSFARGQPVFLRDDPGDFAVIVLSGRLKISNTTSDGREIGLNFVGVGDIFGEVALLDGGKRTADVIALEPSDVLVIDRRTLVPALTEHPLAMLEIVTSLCEKLRIATAIIEDSAHDMSARLAKGLLRLAQQHGIKRGTQIRIDLKMSQADLGSYVGLSRTNVNRQLGLLRSAGIIEVEGSIITIVDTAKLDRLAEDSGSDE